ncbi:uncharacterized protein LOC126592106 [Malus sylvestris]|uniref:uncharacterized protein LOC126592106 n=1 Tax=Malus sylvestris TaxID=3752 RepID=UPI0010AA7EC7|nr:uncharacterized protein LOC103413325 [Malus domestica]XP_050113824.1 uncharacterized protein LOC126592106 [Malus sylvestris]
MSTNDEAVDEQFEEQSEHSESGMMLQLRTQRKTRGPGKIKWASKDGRGKEYCEFGPTGKCISANSVNFSKLIASEVKDPRNLPLKTDWRLIDEDVKEVFWNTIRDTIAFRDEDLVKMPLIRLMTLSIAEHAHKEYRNYLKKIFYSRRQGEDRLQCPPNVDPGQWVEMVRYWDNPKTMEKAEKNRINRQTKTMNHTTGSKTFVRVREEYRKEHGEEPDPIAFFRMTHSRKDSTWVDETAQQKGASMESVVQSKVEDGGEDTPELRTQVYVEEMGPENRNRVRGYGHGVTPVMVPYAATGSSKRSSSSREAIVQAENLKLRRNEEARTTELDELKTQLQQIQATQQQMNQQQQMMMMMFMQGMQQPQTYLPCPLAPQHSEREGGRRGESSRYLQQIQAAQQQMNQQQMMMMMFRQGMQQPQTYPHSPQASQHSEREGGRRKESSRKKMRRKK